METARKVEELTMPQNTSLAEMYSAIELAASVDEVRKIVDQIDERYLSGDMVVSDHEWASLTELVTRTVTRLSGS